MFFRVEQWVHAARDSGTPTLLFHAPSEPGASPALSIWVGNVDVALDDLWLRQLQALIFEICESVLRRRESFATTREPFANLK